MRRMCFISLYEQPISIALLLSTRIGMTFLCSGPSLAEHLPSHSAASSNEPSPFKSHRLLCIPILQKKGQQGQANSSFDQACCPCRTFKKHQYCDQSPLHHSKMSYCKYEQLCGIDLTINHQSSQAAFSLLVVILESEV